MAKQLIGRRDQILFQVFVRRRQMVKQRWCQRWLVDGVDDGDDKGKGRVCDMTIMTITLARMKMMMMMMRRRRTNRAKAARREGGLW